MECQICFEIKETYQCDCNSKACEECLYQSFLSFLNPLCPFCKNEFPLDIIKSNTRLYNTFKELIIKSNQLEELNKIMQEMDNYNTSKNQVDEYLSKELELKKQYLDAVSKLDSDNLRSIILELKTLYDNKKNYYKKKLNYVYIVMNCENSNCKGKVLKRDKVFCYSCKTEYCNECYKLLNDDHKCKEDDLKNAVLLLKSTRSCPKCHNFIEKTQGCNHMHCIVCNTNFDWKEYKLINSSVINNPESNDIYYKSDYIYKPKIEDFENDKIFNILNQIFNHTLINYVRIKGVNYKNLIKIFESNYKKFDNAIIKWCFEKREKYFTKVMSQELFDNYCWKLYTLKKFKLEYQKFMLYCITFFNDYHLKKKVNLQELSDTLLEHINKYPFGIFKQEFIHIKKDVWSLQIKIGNINTILSHTF